MCRELGWNDTLHHAKHADPSDSGIRNRDSPQRSVLVKGSCHPCNSSHHAIAPRIIVKPGITR